MQQLRVDTAGLQAMATRWDASAGELNESVAPARLGLSFQASAAAVNAAHADITAFTTALATRVGNPLEGGSGVVEVEPGWTLCPPWVNKNVPIN